MASPAELERQVVFGLNSLGQRNAHHEFEQLCLGLARRRITSNLLPATGPVSAGGDRSRDGESFWSNLANELPDTSLFVSMISEKQVILACTIQQQDVATKIRSDIAKLGQQNVDRVAYFITGPLAVGIRHRLIEEALNDHAIELQIWDCEAIGHHLKDPDLFYLAVTYLQLPAEFAPDPPTAEVALPDWYVADREHWRNRDRPASTPGDLIELRQLLRYSRDHAVARADLPDWVARVREMLGESPGPILLAQARYEIATATLLGMSDLRPADDLVRSYFEDVRSLDDLGVLEDAAYLVTFGYGAYLRDATDILRDELDSWHAELRTRIDRLLADSPFPNARATLLSLAARLALQQDYPRDRRPLPGEIASITENAEQVRTAVEAGQPIQLDLTGTEFVDLDGAMARLQELVECLQDAPMFPIKHTADLFDLFTPSLAAHPLYATVRDGLDAATERVEGEAARGERAQNRAINLYNSGQLIMALHEVHEAKINWWHGDTIEGGIIMSFLASRIYSDLGFPIAAKQYALSAATAARSSNDPDLAGNIARGFILAATYEHQAGMWLSATETFRIGMLAQHQYTDEPTNLERFTYVNDMLVDQALIVRAARTVRPDCASLIDQAIASVGLGDPIDTMLASVNHVAPMAAEEYAMAADRDGLGRPFSDSGLTRCYLWSALGTTWVVTCANTRPAVLATERFIAGLQITLAELASQDALLLSGTVTIEVIPDGNDLSDEAERCHNLPSNDGSRWEVHLTSVDAIEDQNAHVEVTTSAVQVIADRSLLPRKELLAQVDAAFSQGLWHKLLASRPYDEIADILRPSHFDAMSSLSAPPPGADIPLEVQPRSDEIGTRHGPAPGYDQTEALRSVQARYDNMIPMVRYTLDRLRQETAFQDTLVNLRSEGWLDWHVLTAVANLSGNEKLRRRGITLTTGMTPADKQAAQAAMKEPEKASDAPMPADLFEESRLRAALNGAVLSTLGNLGLASHQHTPDFPAILRFLGERYGYWTDDVPHDPLFSPTPTR